MISFCPGGHDRPGAGYRVSAFASCNRSNTCVKKCKKRHSKGHRRQTLYLLRRLLDPLLSAPAGIADRQETPYRQPYPAPVSPYRERYQYTGGKPGPRQGCLSTARQDPARKRVNGAMLAGALFNRAADIFTTVVDLADKGRSHQSRQRTHAPMRRVFSRGAGARQSPSSTTAVTRASTSYGANRLKAFAL